jgi:hypothetical protein
MAIAYDLSPDSYHLPIAYGSMLQLYRHSVALMQLHDVKRSDDYWDGCADC